MDKDLRTAQKSFLKTFSQKARSFALCGGTALELYYLKHRFSVDLDFFSPKYNISEIEEIVSEFKNSNQARIKLESEFIIKGRAKARFYTAAIKGLKRPLKIDFVEEVFLAQPQIKKFDGIRVYSVEDIYLQKIFTVAGIVLSIDETGREIMQGRNQARDAFDLYMLSKSVKPLSVFLRSVSPQLQRGMVHWYRRFSRQELKLALLDLDIYDKQFNSKEMINHIEGQIEQFIKETME